MRLKKVAIVLVNYKQADLTIECVKSLRKLHYRGCSIIIIDNNSKDGSREKLANYCPECLVILAGENNGYASGCNIGISYAMENGYDYVLLLNNDTVVDKMLVDKMLKYSGPKTIVVPKIYYYDKPDVIWYAGGYIDRKKGNALHYGEGKKDDEVKTREITFATGCCLLLPPEVLRDKLLMDDSYFLYYEDADYSLSLSEQGYTFKFSPEAKLWHKVSSSTGKHSALSEYYINRNRLHLINKFKLGIRAQMYSVITRYVKLVVATMRRDKAGMIIKRSLHDVKNGIMGKQDIL